MAEAVRVAVDAMGGDNAPDEIVKGAVEAVNSRGDIQVTLTGRQEEIVPLLEGHTYDTERIRTVHCGEEIGMVESPVQAIRKKKHSSLVVAMDMVKSGEADAIVSAGNSGAILVGGQTIVGRIRGVERPALAPLVPAKNGGVLLVDAGASVDSRPSHLLQFAQMGSVYMENIVGIENPRVAILNIGEEEEKGNALVREAFPLLKACGDIHFTGSIEAREITEGGADVIVCEGFCGNVTLKMFEGVTYTILSIMKESMQSSPRAKLGAFLLRPALRRKLHTFDASEYGGAPLLGCKGLVVKTHGSAGASDVKNSIFQCSVFQKEGVNDKIRATLSHPKAQDRV